MSQVDWIGLIVVAMVFSFALIRFRSYILSPFVKRRSNIEDDLENQLLEEIYHKVLIHLEQEKFFLRKNIKVIDMANDLNYSEKLVSKAINKHGNGNFNKLINTFRVNHSKEMFSGGNYDHYTVEAIADESGFSNKVSFYNAFKSVTGMSPKQFKALKQD